MTSLMSAISTVQKNLMPASLLHFGTPSPPEWLFSAPTTLWLFEEKAGEPLMPPALTLYIPQCYTHWKVSPFTFPSRATSVTEGPIYLSARELKVLNVLKFSTNFFL